MPSMIEWTDQTWNPVTGCTRVSPGCDHCYMFALYPRLNAMGVRGYEGQPNHVQLLPERLQAPLRWKKPHRVFVNSMSDVFHPSVPYSFINSMFDVMHRAAERKHVFQVLTKRPGRAVAWWKRNQDRFDGIWPAHVWIGTSVESQKYAPRISVLARIPAPIRFVSVEPLLEPVDLRPWLRSGAVKWVIVGGESGRSARPMDLDWVRDLRDQTIEAGAAFFLKQLGGIRNKRGGDAAIIDGMTWRQMPSRRGGDSMNFPRFGGFWTQQKLEILQRYLDTYTTALKNQPFTLTYVDAFAGAGVYVDPDDEYAEFHELHEGSTKIALEISDKQFDRLVFIEKNPERIQSLQELAGQHSGRSIRIIEGNANQEIPMFCNTMKNSDRAVVFLDPFATEVSWNTVKAIADTRKIDCWILFPLMAVTRMMPTGREPDEGVASRLDWVFGGRQNWQQSYQDSSQLSLLGDRPERERGSGNEVITTIYKEQLRTIFHRIAEPHRTLRNSRNGPLFELFFAAGNPNGASTAIRIANHILENW